jgi:hypothetical protein
LANDEMLGLILIGVCIFIFLAIIVFFGSFYGEPWNTVAQGVAKFIIIITIFAYGVYIVVHLAGRR